MKTYSNKRQIDFQYKSIESGVNLFSTAAIICKLVLKPNKSAESITFFKQFRINRIFEKWFGKVFSNYIRLGNVYLKCIHIKCTLKNGKMNEILTKCFGSFVYVFCRLIICINACVSIYFVSTQKRKKLFKMVSIEHCPRRFLLREKQEKTQYLCTCFAYRVKTFRVIRRFI